MRDVLVNGAFVIRDGALDTRAFPGQPVRRSVSPDLTTAVQPRGLRGRGELEAFLDGMMTANMNDKHVAGATVSIVKDGALFFAKGYGYADVDRQTPVDPGRTLFRIGSVSKLFTWTAVMQLVEEGKLDLDVDVNRYLDFKIPATYAKPITLRHMMTHTSGFEEDNRDILANDTNRVGPIGPWLASHIPGRVRLPGVFAAYSNYATALAAYVVERVSGMPWQDYLEQRILIPLEMQHTTVRQPLPATFRTDMSAGYRFSKGRFEPEPWEVMTGLAPAGAISASATDFALFMLAHLGDGAIDTRRILRVATAEQMHARAFAHDPRLPGFALGFYEQSTHGLRIIGHGGNTQWFHSDLTLIPSERLGIFVSYNTDTGHELNSTAFLREFLDHYYPTRPAPPVVGIDRQEQARRVAGEYRFNRMSYTTFQRALGLISPVTVSNEADGSLLMSAAQTGTLRLVPAGPWLYRDESGSDLVAFKTDASGNVANAFIGSLPMMVMERVAWYQSARLHRTVLGLAAAVFILTVWSALLRVIRRRFHQARVDDTLPRRGFVVGAAVAELAFIVVTAVLVSNATALMTASSVAFEFALALPVVAAVLAVMAAIVAVKQWIDHVSVTSSRLRYAATVVIVLLFTWSLNEWNLFGWRF
jgi:CubicO group peptidase (beta-lactamase class C family)